MYLLIKFQKVKKMKHTLLLLLSILCLSSCKTDDSDILKKVLTAVNSHESITYTTKVEDMEDGKLRFTTNYTFSIDYGEELNGITRYHMKSKEGELLYNGKETFQVSPQEKLIIVDDSNDPHYVNMPLTYTPHILKKLLPLILNESNNYTIKKRDTLIGSKNYHMLKLSLLKKEINWLEHSLDPSSNDSELEFYVDGKTNLPYKLFQTTSNQTRICTIENIELNSKKTKEFWRGENLPEGYPRFTQREYSESLERSMKNNIGDQVVDIELPNLNNGELINLSKLTGDVVLLEFWFKNCGACEAAVQPINKLYDNYKDKNFKLYGVEFVEDYNKEELQKHVRKQEVKYPILYKGKELALQYGVRSAPTFMIIDKQGKVVYLDNGYSKAKMKLISDIISKHI